MAEPNWAPKTIWTGDNLPILRGLNAESVDLIYLDPPFNSKVNYAAPIGSQAAGAAFKDTWGLSDVDAEWINLIEAKHPAVYRVLLAAMTDGDKSYLTYMAARLLELRRILKPTGSHLRALRPHHEPLPQAGDGCGLWAERISGMRLCGATTHDWSAKAISQFGTCKHDTILSLCRRWPNVEQPDGAPDG